MENFTKISSLKSFSFPLKSQSGLSYFETLKKALSLFERKVSELEGSDQITIDIKKELTGIRHSNGKILEILSSYLEGNSGKAYKALEELLGSVFYKNKLASLIETLSEKTNLLRVRISLEPLSSRDQMFHIPFSKRHLVANQRFSIAGLPSLYLGSSIYVCWLELGRKDFGGLWISGVRSEQDLQILNLAYDLNLIVKQYSLGDISAKKFSDLFMLWPLVMSCCFQVKYSQSPFHEEYIISSLLLQWIKSDGNNVKGLKYISTKLETNEDPNLGVNYVFPPENVKSDSFCSNLVNTFKLTKPLSWDLMSLVPLGMTFSGEPHEFGSIEEIIAKQYTHTRFGYIERRVFSMTFSNVQNP